MANLVGILRKRQSMVGSAHINTVVSPDLPIYAGTYEVTPDTKEQTLPTANKVMREDLTIKKIPYAEVSNSSGGTTVTIGNEV